MATFHENLVQSFANFKAKYITPAEQNIMPTESIIISGDGNDILETFADGATMHSIINGDTITMTHTSSNSVVTTRTVTITDTLITVE